MLTHLGVNFLDGLPRFWGWGHLCHCSSFRGLCSLCMICGKLWLFSGHSANQETMQDFLSNSKGFGPPFITWTSAILVENQIVFWHFLTINFHYAIDTGHQWLLSAMNGHQHGHQHGHQQPGLSPNLLLCSQALEDPRPERPLPAMPEVGQLGDSRVTQGWSMQYYWYVLYWYHDIMHLTAPHIMTCM